MVSRRPVAQSDLAMSKTKCRFKNWRAARVALALRPAVLATSLLFGAALASLAQTTIVVNSTAQEATTDNLNGIANGNCTLGEAILSANAAAPVDGCAFSGSGAPYTIQLPNQQFPLSSVHNYWYGPNALPPIASNIVIQGNGATLQVTGLSLVRLRFFYVGADANAPATLGFNTPGAGNLTLQNLTLTGGLQRGGDGAGGGAGMGGAIFNQGTLQLIAVTMTNNSATGGNSSGSALGGGGIGQDANGNTGGGFGGLVTPAGSSGGADNDPPPAGTPLGGGGGGFSVNDNGQNGNNGGNGGGTQDGLGAPGSEAMTDNSGHGAGGGAFGLRYDNYCGGRGGNFGSGGSYCGGGGVGGGGGADLSPDAGGGGGFGGGGGGLAFGGFGGGSASAETSGFGGSARGGGAGMGGAIFNHGGTLSILNSTLTANSATGGTTANIYGGGASGLGGAVFNLNGTVTIAWSTLAGNTVATGTNANVPPNAAAGGAIYSLGYNEMTGQAAMLTIADSILSNSVGGPDLVSDQPTTLITAANAATATLNYVDTNIVPNILVTAGVVNGTMPLTSDAQLAALALNAPGLTPTMAISSTSPAFDAGTCNSEVAPTDQRGVARPQGAGCDIGAYELMQSEQTITFTGLPATATYGSAGPYTLNATASSGLLVSYSVTGPASLSGSTLTITGAGTVMVTASQSGNSTYAAATPVTDTISVAQASQTITFTGLPSTATYGSAGPYTLNATASSGLPVSYSVTGPATLSGSTLTITGAGNVAVTASQAGNANYAAATPVTLTIAVSQVSQTITFGAIPAQVVGASVSLSASASSGLAVGFASLTPSVCTVSGATATTIGTGTCTIQATQAGNAEYAAATPVSVSFSVSAAAKFTITPDPGSENVGRGILAAFVLQVKSVDGFSGSVKLSCSGGPSGTKCADLPGTVVVRANQTALALSGILFPANTKAGTYTITFTGVSGALTNTATATFKVK
jgi:hypothetical protein